MSYRITYEWQKEKRLTNNKKFSIHLFLGILALVAVIAVRVMIPQTEEIFHSLLHPLTDETTISAFGDLVDQIGAGTPVEEAAMTFCMEIINRAQS